MLGKLIKYEFKATGRILLPLYGALLVFALINRLLFRSSLDETINNTFGTIGGIANILSVFAYGCTMAAVFVVTFFVIVQRFYKNILGDEGYLMNTLPVKPYLNIINKILTSAIWTIVSCFVAFMSIILLFVTIDSVRDIFSNIIPVLRDVFNYYGGTPFILAIEFFIVGLVELITSITMIYASISIGHLFSKSKILMSFVAFIVLSILSNIINSIAVYIFSSNHISMFTEPSSGMFSGILLISIVLELIYFSIYFFITNYVLTKKLKLE